MTTYDEIVRDRDATYIYNEDGRLMSPAKKYRNFPLFWVNFFMNWDCTRKCPDCWATTEMRNKIGLKCNNPDMFKVNRMDDKTFNRMLTFLSDLYHTHNWGYSAYVFLGGEPLIEYDRIVKLAEYNKKNNMKNIWIALQSNFDLIDDIDFTKLNTPTLVDFNVNTLPIEEIDRRCRILKEFNFIYDIELHMTCFEENFDRIPAITEYAIKNGFRTVVYRNQFKGNDQKYKEYYKKVLHNYFDVIERLKKECYFINVRKNLFDSYFATPTNIGLFHICGRRHLNIYPDGELGGGCVRAIETRIGYNIESQLKDVLEGIKMYDFLHALKSDNTHHECKTCPVRFTCHGGCPYDKMLTYGKNTSENKNPWCEVYKEIFPRLLKLLEGKNDMCIR